VYGWEIGETAKWGNGEKGKRGKDCISKIHRRGRREIFELKAKGCILNI
jgi:hypothetical protein